MPTTDPNVEKMGITQLLLECKHQLDKARAENDPLKIELAEAALNDLLDRYQM